jgi:hypothetical protein
MVWRTLVANTTKADTTDYRLAGTHWWQTLPRQILNIDWLAYFMVWWHDGLKDVLSQLFFTF